MEGGKVDGNKVCTRSMYKKYVVRQKQGTSGVNTLGPLRERSLEGGRESTETGLLAAVRVRVSTNLWSQTSPAKVIPDSNHQPPRVGVWLLLSLALSL